MFGLFKKSYTYEELLVIKVMTEIKELIQQCPFQYLAFYMVIEAGDDRKVLNYIVNNKKLYVDINSVVTLNNKDLNLNKYCDKFDGRPRNFLELDRYEFIFANMDAFRINFQDAIKNKKLKYGIKDN